LIDTTLYYTITQYATLGLLLRPPNGLGRTSTSSQCSPRTYWPMPTWWRTSAPSRTSEASCGHPNLKNPDTLKSRGFMSGELGARFELFGHLSHVSQWYSSVRSYVFTVLTTLGVLTPTKRCRSCSSRSRLDTQHTLCFPEPLFNPSCWLIPYGTRLWQRPWGVIFASRKFTMVSCFVSTTSNCCMILKCYVFSVSYIPNLSGNSKITSPACLV
jgi:hypothetical protein